VPPAVALLNYISCGILWRIFLPNWDISRGFLYISLISSQCCLVGCIVAQESTTLPRIFSKTGIYLNNIDFAERNIEAAMGGGGGIYLGCTVAQLGSSVAQ
jgi:hypothetical protein